MRTIPTSVEDMCARINKRAAEISKNNKNQDLNNLNFISTNNHRSPNTLQTQNLNNLNVHEERKGVPRIELYTDDILKKSMQWGVEEWFVQVCIRDYGLQTVKSRINKVFNIPEGYFKQRYGPIPQQRGKIFHKEMDKLRPALEKQA